MRAINKLLEMAADAVSLPKWRWSDNGEWIITPYNPHGFNRRSGDFRIWNPLENSDDALDLAAALNISIIFDTETELTETHYGDEDNWVYEMWEKDKAAATRLAITRAAAMIWETKCKT